MPRNLDRRIWYKFAATPSLECESGDAAGHTTYMPSSGLAICGNWVRIKASTVIFPIPRVRVYGKANYPPGQQ